MPNGHLADRRRRRRRLTLSLALAATTGGAALVIWGVWPAAPYVLIAGAGHGRGLSQNGAFDQAKDGWSADRILDHYYPGATLTDIGRTITRVRLMDQDDETLSVTSESTFFVADRRVIPGQAAHLTPTATGADVTITQGCDGDTLWEGSTDDPWAYPGVNGSNRPAEEHLQICGGNAYRGVLGVALDDGSPRTVNEIDLDDYLRGVVPAEIVPGWADQGGEEALRAQAIAARSYALAEHRYSYADTCDTTDCQMYPGTGQEDPRTDAAVEATSGRVLTLEAHVLRTEYSAAPDGGAPTPAGTLELGPPLTDFPSANSVPADPSAPAPADADPALPAETDPAAIPDPADPTAAQQDSATTPDADNRTRVTVPLPYAQTLARTGSLSGARWIPDPAGGSTSRPATPAGTPESASADATVVRPVGNTVPASFLRGRS